MSLSVEARICNKNDYPISAISPYVNKWDVLKTVIRIKFICHFDIFH